jgi:hypothetical protein
MAGCILASNVYFALQYSQNFNHFSPDVSRNLYRVKYGLDVCNVACHCTALIDFIM